MRKTVATLVAVAALLSAGAPAWAHEEINPKQFPTGQPTFFMLSAANEQKADLTKVTLAAPKGVAFGATTKEPPGWTVNRADDVITWTGGAVKPDTFEQWGYEIESADQPGVLTYKVTLGYADGKSDDVNVAVTAVAPGTTATTAAAPIPGGGATTTLGTAAAAPAKASSVNAARSRANIALRLAAAALVASLVALGLAARKRANGGTAAPPAASGGTGAKQDW
jgi:uncharacterized protein YcnI